MLRLTNPDAPIMAGFSQRRSYYIEPVVCHEEHELNVALSGTGLYRFPKGPQITLAAGEILLLPGGLSHGIEVQQNLRMAVIHFHPCVYGPPAFAGAAPVRLLRALRQCRHPMAPRKVLHPEAHALLARLTEESNVEQHAGRPGRCELLTALAVQAGVWFLRLMQIVHPEAPIAPAARAVLEVRSWIDRHFADPCSLQQLAERACLAPTYFAVCFRQTIGVPPMNYVRARRIEQARLLLQRTAQPIKVIAWSVGFSDITHFTHAFRRATGLSPARYREAGEHRTP